MTTLCPKWSLEKGTTNKSGAMYFVPRRQKGCPFWAFGEYLLQKKQQLQSFFLPPQHNRVIKRQRQSPPKPNSPGQREPIPLCQSKQIAKQRKPIAFRIVQKHRNTTSPFPPPRSNRGANSPIPSTSKGSQGDPQPPLSSSSSKKNGKTKLNRPPPGKEKKVDLYSVYRQYSTTKRSHVDHTVLPANTPHLPPHRWLDCDVLSVWSTGCGERGRLGRRIVPYSCFYHVCSMQWNMRGLQANCEKLSLLLS